MLLSPAQPFHSSLTDKRILVTDSDLSVREIVADTLQQEGVDVVTAASARETQTFLEAGQQKQSISSGVDLLILDVVLPDGSGLDLCKKLRQSGSNMPILIISTRASELDRVVGLEVGADDYLTKPFGTRELIARCRALLRRFHSPNTPTEKSLRIREILLFPESYQVTLKGSTVELTPKEFQLLKLLMSYPKRVWTREQIIERIWGEDYVGDTKTVDVHIRWLREKLEEEPSQPEYILTVRGFGYRME